MSSIILPDSALPNPDMSPVTIFAAPYSEDARQSHELLRRAATIHTGGDPGIIAVGPCGKPFFQDNGALHFSISHSGDYWLCAFSAQPVGIDLQRCRSFVPPETLSRRFFHPREDAFLSQNCYIRFYDLWTAKESWVKFTGRGFYDEPETFSVVAEDGGFPVVEGAQMRHIPFREGYSLCVCCEDLDEIIFRDMT